MSNGRHPDGRHPFRDRPPDLHPKNYQWALTQKRIAGIPPHQRSMLAGRFDLPADQCFVFLVGEIVTPPSWQLKKQGLVWFRIKVASSLRNRFLWLPVRAQGPVGEMVFANCNVGDRVGVTGEMWTGRLRHQNFTYVFAHNVAFNLPLLVDRDRRYVRVRADTWNALVKGHENLRPVELPEPQPLEPEGDEADWAKTFEDPTQDDEPHPEIDPR